jgi:hypothetical protein
MVVVLAGRGESIRISGMRPPWGMPSLMSASEISQVEKAESDGSLAADMKDLNTMIWITFFYSVYTVHIHISTRFHCSSSPILCMSGTSVIWLRK